MARRSLGAPASAGTQLVTLAEVQAIVAAAGGGGSTEMLSKMRPPVGGYISPAYTQSATPVPTTGDLVMGYQFIPASTYDMVAVRVQTPQTGGLVKVVAYDMGTDGLPTGAPAVETAAAAASNSGFLGIALPTALVVPAAGRAMWVGVVSQGTAGVSLWATTFGYGPYPRIVGSGTNIDLGGTSSATSLRISGVTGAAPSNPTGALLAALDGPVFKVAFRRSA